MQALMLTAGLGTRLRPITDRLAKPAVPVCGVPMLAYPLAILKELEVHRVVFNLHHLPKTIEAAVSQLYLDGCKFGFSDETTEILGSGGAIPQAAPLLKENEDLVLINGDAVFLLKDERVLKNFAEHHRKSQAVATLLVMEQEGVGEQWGGVYCSELQPHSSALEFGAVVTFSKMREPGLRAFHYVGLLILSPSFWPLIPPGVSNLIYDHLLRAIKQGHKVEAVVVPSAQIAWFETGDLNGLVAAEKAIEGFGSTPASPYRRAVEKVRELTR